MNPTFGDRECAGTEIHVVVYADGIEREHDKREPNVQTAVGHLNGLWNTGMMVLAAKDFTNKVSVAAIGLTLRAYTPFATAKGGKKFGVIHWSTRAGGNVLRRLSMVPVL